MNKGLLLILGVGLIGPGCGGGSGDGGRGPVEVLQGDAAIQAAAGVVITMTSALDALLGSAAAMQAGARSGIGSGRSSRAVRVDCPLGGVIDGDCREDGGRTFVTTASQNCGVVDDETGLTAIANGRLDATYEATGICGRSVPEGVAVTFSFADYREELLQDGSVVGTSETRRLTQVSRPALGGCSENDGEVRLDGDLRTRDASGDFEIRMHSLSMDIVSSGNPCTESVDAAGDIDVADLQRGSRFAGLMEGVRMTRRVALDGLTEISVDGEADIDCLGRLRIRTTAALALSGSCPIEGAMDVVVGDLAEARVEFGTSGVAFDYQVDGVADFEAAICGSDAIASCE